MTETTDATEPVHELLLDAFGRVRDLVRRVADGLTPDAATYQPDPDSNSVAWLLWHLIRIQDDHIADVAGVEQAWTAQGWYDQFGLPFDEGATGFAHSAADVAALRVPADLLVAYHADVHALTERFVEGLGLADLERIVDERWDPPVTMSVRLVSVISDCLQHVGQAAYLRGVADRRD